MDTLTRFHEAAAHHNRDRQPSGWRYPPPIRRLAVAYCREQRDVGDAFSKIAEDLDITTPTLGRWLDDDAAPRTSTGTFHAVRVVEPQASDPPEREAALSITTPDGLRIEGLDFAQVLELTRAWR